MGVSGNKLNGMIKVGLFMSELICSILCKTIKVVTHEAKEDFLPLQCFFFG